LQEILLYSFIKKILILEMKNNNKSLAGKIYILIHILA